MAASVMAASIAAARPPRKRLRHAADCGGPRRLLWARSMTHAAPAPAPETLRVQKTRIPCDGTGGRLAEAALGPPRVRLEIGPDDGKAHFGSSDRHVNLHNATPPGREKRGHEGGNWGGADD